MYVGRYRPGVPASGTRDRRLRGYLVSSARCPRVETDLAAAVLSSVLNLGQSIVGPTIGSSTPFGVVEALFSLLLNNRLRLTS